MAFYFVESLRGERVRVFDTTLRDGEQTPGVSLTWDEKIQIAHQLDKLGVDVIEAGFPISSEGEKESVRDIAREGLDASICGLARVTRNDIDACLDADVDLVHVFVSTSDVQREHTIRLTRDEVVERSIGSVEYVKDHGYECLFSAMDATRTPVEYLKEIYGAVEDAGADYINVPDTVGVAMPTGMYKFIEAINDSVSVPIDVHCHNDFGLAVANSLAAVEAGARQVQVTLNSLGERAGNADLAQTVMSLHSIYDAETRINTEYIYETAKLVERLTGVHVPPTWPVVGENAFSHESGIHAHGVIQRSDTFEPGVMTPEMVGHRRRLVLGKHTGKHTVIKMLEDTGLNPTEEQLREILQRVKELGDKGKRVTDADLYAITEAVMGELARQEQTISLQEVSVMTGNVITPVAAVKALVEGQERKGAQVGVGPVDAAMNAVQSIIGEEAEIKVRDFRIEAITGGSDALAEVIVGVEDKEGHIVTARAAREDIVMASVEALVNAVNRLMIQRKKGV